VAARHPGASLNTWHQYTLNGQFPPHDVIDHLVSREDVLDLSGVSQAAIRLADSLAIKHKNADCRNPLWAPKYNNDLEPIWLGNLEPPAISAASRRP